MHTKLKQFFIELRDFQSNLRNENVSRISKIELKVTAETLAGKWFSDIKPEVTTTETVTPEIISTYDVAFENLLKLAGSNNLKSSYLTTLGDITKPFRATLLTPFIKQPQASSTSLILLNQILSAIPDPNENEYIKEAIRCAQRSCPRGAVILGWCAAVNRIHNKL